MLITKIYNNNAVESRDKNHREIVVVGCGIAFRKFQNTENFRIVGTRCECEI